MTAEAALAKLAYVLGKKMSLKDTQTMLVHDLRGELTEERDDHQFERYTHGFIELVDKSLRNYYPLGSHKNFMQDLEDKIANEVFHNYTSEQFC